MGLIYVQDKGFDCGQCDRRKRCKMLCPPIEWAANQVEAQQTETPIEPHKIEGKLSTDSTTWPEPCATQILIIRQYFFGKQTSREIAEYLDISQQYVNRVIKKYKSEIEIIIENITKNGF